MKTFNYNIAIKAFCDAEIDYLINVPATGMSPIYDFFEKNRKCIYAVREEEAVALACGISIAGKLPLVFIQQSGVGNMLNAFIGLAEGYNLYFPTVVLDRGINDENPIQAYSSYRTIPVIKALGSFCFIDFINENAINVFCKSVKEQKRWIVSSY